MENKDRSTEKNFNRREFLLGSMCMLTGTVYGAPVLFPTLRHQFNAVKLVMERLKGGVSDSNQGTGRLERHLLAWVVGGIYIRGNLFLVERGYEKLEKSLYQDYKDDDFPID